MHDSSMEEMRRFVATLDRSAELLIADIGAYDVNGSYRRLFANEHWTYTGIDVGAGPNVDLVVPELYSWSDIADDTYDVVVSGQVMEHVTQPWKWIEEIVRIAKPGATICIIAPHTWGYHEHPIDCWRVWPDGMRGLFRHASIEEQRVYCNSASDTVGIGVTALRNV